MKETLYTLLMLIPATWMGCSKAPVQKTPEEIAVQRPVQIAAPVANAVNDFSFKFFSALQSDPQFRDQNTFVSPLSLHMALGMLVNGATGTTRTEILKALQAEGVPLETLNDSYKTLLEQLPAADPKVSLGLANSIWHKNSFPVENNFLNSMKNTFHAQVTGLPFVQDDVTVINKWASDQTAGKIKKVIDQIDPQAVMFIMNALYFKGDWTTKFDIKNTRDQVFNLQDGSTKSVKMMNLTDTFDAAVRDDYTAVRLPYGNQQFAATIILPTQGGKNIESVLNQMTLGDWNNLQNAMAAQDVVVGLPKFKLEQEFPLNAVLKKLGMQKAFTEQAELDGINKTWPLSVSFVKQNTFAAVDEEGTEAAAVTTIGIVLTSYPGPRQIRFICDRPFGIIISEKTSNSILFMGKILNP